LRRATGDLTAAALPVSSGGFEPPLPTFSTSCLLPLGYEDIKESVLTEPCTTGCHTLILKQR
jgi:hypothetical protein